jgi:O-succinylbenzoic acid--CoA ligase
MTETASQVVTAAPGERAGVPLPGVELKIGNDGEILVRGPMVARAALGTDGWLHTGDRGHIDAEGRLHVAGRLKEIIVTGGENVSPVEVEEALLSHPAVIDAGVAGIPDPDWGEAITAFVVLAGDASGEELRDWARERLAPHKVPKRVEPMAELPRNAAGKLLRSRLAGSDPSA